MSCPVALYPKRQPAGHKPPVPRWTLRFPDTAQQIATAYFGVQLHGDAGHEDSELITSAVAMVHRRLSSLSHDYKPFSIERFFVERGQDVLHTHVWVCYWSDMDAYRKAMAELSIADTFTSLPVEVAKSVGLWCERFTTPASRLETNYSGLDYLPGIARMPNTSTEEHDLTAYWGAARDRIADSGNDLFAKEPDQEARRRAPEVAPRGIGQRITGANPYDNLVHIRSGQFWENCGDVEREAYESTLEPTLLDGLQYLWDNPIDNGVIGLRYMRNMPVDDGPPQRQTNGSSDAVIDQKPMLKETCGAGFFRNLSDLEYWAEKHISHKRIWLGAIKHAKTFGEARKFRTWHEVSVLKKGEAHFEYINCAPETGAIKYMRLEQVEDI